MSIALPTPESNSGSNDWSDVYSNDKVLKEAIESLQATAGAVRWYTPTVISAEETRTSTSYGYLATEDKVSGVNVSNNGLLLVFYSAQVKSSVSAAGRAAIFIGSNQPQRARTAATTGTSFQEVFTSAEGAHAGLFTWTEGIPAEETTGSAFGPPMSINLPAGAYDVSVKFSATSGSVTAKERKLWVATLGD